MCVTVVWQGQSVESLQCDQELFQCLSCFLEPILLEGYFAQLRYMGVGLGPASKRYARLCCLPMETLLSPRYDGVCGGWKVGVLEEERERELD